MAKQKAEKPSVNPIFKELLAQQNSVSPDAAVSATNMYANVEMFIPTGSLVLDRTLSNRKDMGGWPCGRIIEVYGQESTGKSTLAYQAMKNTQDMKGLCIFFDAEQAGSMEMMQNCGVNTDEVIYSRLNVLEDIFTALEKNLKYIIGLKEYKNKPVFVLVDSLAAMTTTAEDEGDYELNMNTATKKAVQIGHALRKITPLLTRANAVLYVVNQLRDKIGVMFGDPTTTPGGKAIKFYATIRIKLQGKSPIVIPDPYTESQFNLATEAYEDALNEWKLSKGDKKNKPEKPLKKDFKGDEILIGYDVTAKTDKNKIAPPHREAQFRLLFGEGVVDEYSWLDYGIKFGIIEDAKREDGKRDIGSFVITGFKNTIGSFKRNEWMDVICDAEIHDKMKKVLIDKVVRDTKNVASFDNLSNAEDLMSDDDDEEIVDENDSEELTTIETKE